MSWVACHLSRNVLSFLSPALAPLGARSFLSAGSSFGGSAITGGTIGSGKSQHSVCEARHGWPFPVALSPVGELGPFSKARSHCTAWRVRVWLQ